MQDDHSPPRPRLPAPDARDPYFKVSRRESAERLGLSIKTIRLDETAALRKIQERLALLDPEERSYAFSIWIDVMAEHWPKP